MAHFQNENIHLTITNSNSENENIQSISINEINQPLSAKRNRQTSIDNLNANRPRINSFPVPPLPRDETPDDEYFDAECKLIHYFLFLLKILFVFHLAYIEGMATSRSFRSVKHSIDDNITLSSIDDDERTYVDSLSDDGNNKCSIEFLILIFYGGMLELLI
jgi:hypothetical protein